MHKTNSYIAIRFIPVVLGICYVWFPLSNIFSKALGIDLWRNWINLAWVLVAFSSTLVSHRKSSLRQFEIFGSLIVVVVFLFWLAVGAVVGNPPQVIVLMEAKPLFYLFVTLLLLRANGPPREEDFCRLGGWLSFILVIEMVTRSVMTGELERPVGSGEVNYDAALLCLSLIFALGRRDLARRYGPIIFLGLLATFSRTGLLAASLVLIFSGSISLTLRALMVCLALGAAVVSFVIRDLEIGALNSMDRYWMWFVALEHITANLSATALVETPGTSIDVEVPNSLKQLWLDQQEALEIEGIFPFHFHSMWLRLTMAWGWIPAVLILLVMLNVLLFRGHRPSQARSLAGVCLVLGLTMGLFYLSNVSIPVLLAMFRLFIQQPRVK